VWLSTMRDERAMRILAAWDIENTRDYAGPNARVSIRDIFDDIALIRKEGYSVVREEGEVGVCVVAAAVFDSSRPESSVPVGTLSIAGPIARMREETLGAHIESLKRAAINVGEHWALWTSVNGNDSTPTP
jgi:IclR family acetate operon transcriptional repressor